MKPIFAFRKGSGGPGHYVFVDRELWPIVTSVQKKKAAAAITFRVNEPLPRHTADVWRWDGKDFYETDLVFDVRDEDEDES